MGSIQTETGKVPEPVVHDGLQFKFPFDTQKQSYPYFDTTFKQSRDVHFVEETELDGLPVYRFHQEIEPTQVGGGISLPASVWGREGTGWLKLPRFYSITRICGSSRSPEPWSRSSSTTGSSSRPSR